MEYVSELNYLIQQNPDIDIKDINSDDNEYYLHMINFTNEKKEYDYVPIYITLIMIFLLFYLLF